THAPRAPDVRARRRRAGAGMSAVASPLPPVEPLTPVPKPIPSLPNFSPGELVRPPVRPLPFPFGDRRTHYFYLGRGAVHRAVELLGLVGEEVLVPAYHHGVEVAALVHAGAKLRFYGVKRDFTVDMKSLTDQLTEQTRALYVIHYAGFPQPM